MSDPERQHAYLSASGAHRWMRCPAAPRAAEGYVDEDSYFAREGTAAHELAALAMEENLPASDWIITELPESGWTVDSEMAEHVQTYIDYVDKLRGVVDVEVKLDMSRWIPDGFGTADACASNKRTLTVVDLKYGRGVRVDATNNPQLMLYGLGALAAYEWLIDPTWVKIVTHQPRLDHVDEWRIKARDLLEWGKTVRDRAAAALAPGAPRVPGETQCRWCVAKADCPAQARMTEDLALTDFGASPRPIETLSDAELSTALRWRPAIESWLKAVEARVRARVEAGGFDGWKLVEGRRANRQWADGVTDAVVDLVGDAARVPAKLITPAAAEKIMGKRKGELRDLIAPCGPGKPTLVPDDDKRPSISVTADDFEDLNN